MYISLLHNVILEEEGMCRDSEIQPVIAIIVAPNGIQDSSGQELMWNVND